MQRAHTAVTPARRGLRDYDILTHSTMIDVWLWGYGDLCPCVRSALGGAFELVSPSSLLLEPSLEAALEDATLDGILILRVRNWCMVRKCKDTCAYMYRHV